MSSTTATFSAIGPGQGGRLTPKEAQLLAALRENPGRCLTRKWLLQAVWGYSPDARSRTVDVHIRKLRRTLEPEEARRIRTIVRQGYYWDAR